MLRPLTARLGGPALLALLSGCGSPPPSTDSVDAVSRLTQPHTHQALVATPPSGDQIARELREPLGADAAVRLALQNHRGLQSRLARLGVTEAEVAEAGALPNPGFRFSRLTRAGEVELEAGWHLNLARLLSLPLRRQAEARRLQAEQAQAAADVLSLVAEVRRAWVRAVAAEEALAYRRQLLEAAEAGAELARRMQVAGNFNALARAREQAFETEARLALARAEALRLATRERLVRGLGLEDGTLLRLPEQLPALPPAARELPDVEAQALAQRLDVQAARLALEWTASQLDLARSTRWVSMLELGSLRKSDSQQPAQRGWEVALELPLFGPGPVPKAEALAREAAHQAADVAIQARSEAREAYGLYRSAYALAREHRDALLPLAQQTSQQQLLRYNAMLIGVFELLADARRQAAAVSAAQGALRDFWLAQVDLDQALVGRTTPTLPDAPQASAAPASH